MAYIKQRDTQEEREQIHSDLRDEDVGRRWERKRHNSMFIKFSLILTYSNKNCTNVNTDVLTHKRTLPTSTHKKASKHSHPLSWLSNVS